MGHDISAIPSGLNNDVAYNGRNAGDPLNKVLYLILGVEDEAYGGCSGYGCTLSITREQLITAEQILKNKDFSAMTLDHWTAEILKKILGLLSSSEDVHICRQPANTGDVSRECEFIERCIAYLDKVGGDSIPISFS
jgi:hypothetical protein